MGYCKYKKEDGFHRCGSGQFNLWQKDIQQGELCDVHYWQTEYTKIKHWSKQKSDKESNLSFENTVRALKSQVKQLREELSKCKNNILPVDKCEPGTPHTEWHSGPPPHIGWWCCTELPVFSPDKIQFWRWWSGKKWSLYAANNSSLEHAVIAANKISLFHRDDIYWSDCYPEDARVPRIDPSKIESTK
jgi:hypothetical protein